MGEHTTENDAPDWQAHYVEICRRVTRMANEPARVRMPAELRDLLVYDQSVIPPAMPE